MTNIYTYIYICHHDLHLKFSNDLASHIYIYKIKKKKKKKKRENKKKETLASVSLTHDKR